MSRAHTQITAVLAEHNCSAWSPEQIEHVADLLMPIIRDTVGRGFDAAANILEPLDLDGRAASHLLRNWAADARWATVTEPGRD